MMSMKMCVPLEKHPRHLLDKDVNKKKMCQHSSKRSPNDVESLKFFNKDSSGSF